MRRFSPGRTRNLLLGALAAVAAADLAFGQAAERSAADPFFSASWIYATDGPAVVVVKCSAPDGSGEMGTGSLVGPQEILTNAHVVTDGRYGSIFGDIRVYFKPPKVYGDPQRDLNDSSFARVLYYDPNLDLALLRLERAPGRVAPMPIGDSDAVGVGDRVAAIGHPEGGGLWTMTQGIVGTVISNQGGVYGKDIFQTDASINRGNSGGPLIAADGQMIGINSSMMRKASDGLAITSVNFAIKSNVARRWLAQNGWNPPPSRAAPRVAAAAPRAVKPPPPPKPAPAPPARPVSAPAAAAPAAKAVEVKEEPADPRAEQLVAHAVNGEVWPLRWMLWTGTNPNLRNFRGDTALTAPFPPLQTFDAVQKRTQVMALLLDHGASPDAPSRHGLTPLMRAIYDNDDAGFQLLMDHGAGIDGVDDGRGWTTLMFAAANDLHDYLNPVLAKGAVLNVADRQGVTPLMIAAEIAASPYGLGANDGVKLLLSKGADPKYQDAQGRTARDYAVEGRKEFVERAKTSKDLSFTKRNLVRIDALIALLAPR